MNAQTSAQSDPRTGAGLTSYYLVRVDHPQRAEQAPYTAECEDLIEALGMNPDEANIFKEIWRTANARTNCNGKPGNTDLRASEKIEHYGNRLLRRARRRNGAEAANDAALPPIDARLVGDGWTDWHGGMPPVGQYVNVEVVLRGTEGTHTGWALHWNWRHGSADPAHEVIQYRIHTPTPEAA